ncbi:MAG: RrF2 family transcriptional regulator [Candidatus Methylomirabilia bacterium]
MRRLADGLRSRWQSILSVYPFSLLTSVRLSRESEYGLDALRVLAMQPPSKVMLVEEIAEAGHLPPRFLAQILQKLRRYTLVSSHRGAVRGYSLARPPHNISLREIFEAVEGPDFFTRCLFWPEQCNDQQPCSLHNRWAKIRPKLRAMLEGTTLAQMAPRPGRGGSSLGRRTGRKRTSRRMREA